jgi:hypothetical protein
VPLRPGPPTPSGQTLLTYSRWKKSATTFGPTGRIVASVALLVPLPVLFIAASLFIGLVGTGIYLLVIVPWALKDIWQRAAIPVSAPVGTAARNPSPIFEGPAFGWEDRRDAANSPDR